MTNAEKLRKLTFGDEPSFDCIYNFIPDAIQVKTETKIPTKVKIRYATQDDIAFCVDFVYKYNTRYNIEYERTELERDIGKLISETGLFLILEGSKGVFGLVYLVITKCNAHIKGCKEGLVVNISNIMLAKQYVNNGSVYMDTISTVIDKITNWGIFSDNICVVDLNIFMSSIAAKVVYNYFRKCAGTILVGESDDGFNSVLLVVSEVVDGKDGSKYLKVKDTFYNDTESYYKSCSDALERYFNDTDYCIDIDDDFCTEDLSYFINGDYKSEPTVVLPLRSLRCMDLSAKLYGRHIVNEQKELNGDYFPLVINCNREVVLNKTTYWILIEQGIEYVKCIIQ